MDNIDEALNEIFGKDASFRSNGKNLFRQRRNQEIRELMEKVKEHDKPVTLKPVRPPTDEERKKHPEWFDE